MTALSADTGTAGDFITNVASQTVSGTFTGALGAGEKIQVSANGGTIWVDATVGPGSSWSASGVTLSAGTGTLLVQSIDTAGNATAGTGHSYTLQTSGPSAIATVTALSADTGASGSDFITNVASQTVSGTFTGALGAGEKIQVSADGGTIWVDATVGPGSSWSASGVTLSAGSGTLSVRSIDAANNTTAGTGHGYTLDATPPSETFPTVTLTSDTGASNADFITSNGGVHFAGTVADTGGAGIASVQVFNGATLLGTATVVGGNWSLDTTLAAGTYNNLKVTVTDLAGNANTTTNAQTLIVDATPPSETFPTVTLTSDTGASNADFITSNGGVHFAGTVADTGAAGIASVQVFNGATLLGTATVVGGNWSLDTTLAAGTYNNLKVTVTDLAGNANTTTNAQTLIVDATPPSAVATVTALSADTGTAGDFITNVASQTVSGTFTGALGAGEKIQVSANGGTIWVDATVGPGSSWSASGVTLSAGTGTLLVQSIDTAGNATAGTGHGYTLQTSGPSAIATVTALSADTGTAGDFITNVASQTISGTFTGALGAGEKIQVSADGGTIWVDATVGPGSSWSASGVTLSAGSGTLSVRSIDAANNTTAGTGHGYTLDATPPSETFPTVTLTSDTGASNADFITSNGGVHFAGTVADTGGAGIASVQVFNGATLLGTATVVGGNWSLDTTLAAGTYNNLKVTVTDLAGNADTTTNAQTLIVDATPPSAVATVTALSAPTLAQPATSSPMWRRRR